MARKRRTKAEILAAQSEGLGDTVEKVLEVTGVAKVAKWLLGEDCKCDERKEKLNEWFSYRKPECLLEHEHEFLSEWFKKYEYYLIWISVPSTLISIRAIKLINEHFNGLIWPNRILTFSIGIVLFTILTSYHFDEKLNLKTLTLLFFCASIVALQIFWK